MKHYNTEFRVLSTLEYKTPLEYLMSGYYHYHSNMIHSIKPEGLNRSKYQLMNLEEFLENPSETGEWKHVIERISKNAQYPIKLRGGRKI